MANVPKTRGSLAGATLQIHEAEETHKLGICMIITGRGKIAFSISRFGGAIAEALGREETNGVGEVF